LVGVGVAAVMHAHTADLRAADAVEKARLLDGRVSTLCDMRVIDLGELSRYMKDVAWRGRPPGSELEALGGWALARTSIDSACGVTAPELRQMGYLNFLTRTEQWQSAANRAAQLAKTKREDWSKLEIAMPPDELADDTLELHRHLPSFSLSAWERWHPDAQNDRQSTARAHVFTLLDGAAVAWRIAIANRTDLFDGTNDGTVPTAVRAQLGAIGLHVDLPNAGADTLAWAWSALDAELERRARDAEGPNFDSSDSARSLGLVDGPYDYQRFREVLERVRSAPKAGAR